MRRRAHARAVIALDGATGELRWVHGEQEGRRAAVAPRLLSGRGLSYWTDGKEERILYITLGFQLVALDAKSGGARVAGFGKDGLVDLKEAAIVGGGQKNRSGRRRDRSELDAAHRGET